MSRIIKIGATAVLVLALMTSGWTVSTDTAAPWVDPAVIDVVDDSEVVPGPNDTQLGGGPAEPLLIE